MIFNKRMLYHWRLRAYYCIAACSRWLPWDIEQTHQSVRANLIEETYEAVEAIDTNNMELLKEELGDVLMQVLFHAQMEAEQGTFTFADVVDGVAKKLIVRHPHVFGNVQVTDSSQVLSNWDEIKKKTKSQTTQTEVLESVSVALPALMRSYKVQKKSGKKLAWMYRTQMQLWTK